MTQWAIVDIIPRTQPFRQCCDASIQSVDPLPVNSFQSINTDFVQNFSDSRKKFICRPELLALEAVFEMPKQGTRKSQRELSPGSTIEVVDLVQFARNCHRNTLLSLLLYLAVHCPHVRPTSFHFSPFHAKQRSR
jgi:hypothetical protein